MEAASQEASGLERASVCSVDGANVGHNARICPDNTPAEGALTLRKLDFLPHRAGLYRCCPLPGKRGLGGGGRGGNSPAYGPLCLIFVHTHKPIPSLDLEEEEEEIPRHTGPFV